MCDVNEPFRFFHLKLWKNQNKLINDADKGH